MVRGRIDLFENLEIYKLEKILQAIPKGPWAQIVHTLVPMYLYREYFKAKVYTNNDY